MSQNMQLWFRVAAANVGKDNLSWKTPDVVRLNLSEAVIAVIERAIASSDPESNSVANSMGATVSTEIDLPEGCVECLNMEANGAPQVQYVPSGERFVRPNVTASMKGVSLRIWGVEHEALVRTERVALKDFRLHVRTAYSQELIGAMEQAMEADTAPAPRKSGPAPI